MDTKLFERLVATPGVSGREERIRDLVLKEIQPLVDEVSIDKMGSIIARRKGKRPRVMLSAHMDSIGFLVKYVDDNGFVWPSPVGGFDPRTLAVQRVIVSGKQDYPGLMFWKTKPIHVLTDDERGKAPKMDDIYIDLMAPADEVKANVAVGDPITLHRTPLVTKHAISAPYLDDRLGVYVLLDALKQAKKTKAEIFAVVSVQEEVGLRGARSSAFGTDPDIGIALDVTLATDTPGVEPAHHVSHLREGVAITVMDGASIADPRLVKVFEDLAKKHDIRYQKEILPRGGTDAGAIQATRAGVPVITVSMPTRYVHTTNEMADISDVDASVDLVARFMEKAHDVDLSSW